MSNPGARLSLIAAVLVAASCSADHPTALSSSSLQAARESGSSSEAIPVSFTILPNVVVGGDAGTPSGTVTVESAASFDRTLKVSSNNPTVLPFLSTATTVPAFSTRAGVQIIPSAVSAPTVVTIFVSGGGVTVSADLTVNPPGTPAPPPTLSTYTVSPGTVNGGETATGTITLPGPAPEGGVVISLFTRIPASATVPSSVTVPAGADRVSFPVSTFPGFPNSTTSVLLTALHENTVISSSINVVTGGATTETTSPLAAPALLSPANDARFARGSTVAFDWKDVTGAATYTIQIATSDKFASPLVANQTVTTSQFTASGLPTTRMWWRVRAISPDGVTGQWSSARRFELK